MEVITTAQEICSILHNYPGPELYLYDAERPTVLGEYGGIGLPLEGHLWQPDKNWGYVQFKNSKEVTDEYVKYAEALKKLIKAGLKLSKCEKCGISE